MTKKLWTGLLLVMAGLQFAAAADVSVAVDIHTTADFSAPLAGSGAWVDVGSYGRCWHPRGVGADWRPYCSGEWVWTDSGWYWSSDEPWAWACYHYGYWGMDPQIGWFWVPGLEWSPAWVSWRSGGGYIGWAPIGPRGVVPGANLFAFVEIGHFGEPMRPQTVVVNNAAIISKTTVMNNVRHESRDIGGGGARRITINDGPSAAEVEKATGRKFTAAPIAEAVRRSPAPRPSAFPPTQTRETPAPQAPLVRPETPSKPELPSQPAPPLKPENPERGENPALPPPPVKPIVPARPNVPEKPTTPEKPEPPRKPEEAPHVSRLQGFTVGFAWVRQGPAVG